jgi:bromodomain adjacent to zinc finger domain protein 1A
LPYHLKNARDVAYSKSRKRKLVSDTEGERKAPMDASQREKLKEEKERIREERRQQAAIKYPVDDIDLPIYRKDPINSWQLVDMTLTSNNELPSPIPYPSGGRPLRPVPWKEFSVPAEYFEPYIMTWIFLSTFAEPLGLDPFTIDDFEAGLCQTTSKSLIIIESYSALLNAIVRERKDGVLPGCIAGGPTTTSPISSRSATPNRTSNSIKSEKMQIDETLDESDKPDNASENGKPHDNENALSPATSTSEPSALERGQGSTDVNKVSKNWDNREIRSDRRGWEATLIGCLNEVIFSGCLCSLQW